MLDKKLMELSAQFVIGLKMYFRAKDFRHIETVLNSPKLSQYRNLITIYLTLRPIELFISHQSVIETAVVEHHCKPAFLFQILSRCLKLSKQMKEKDDLTEDEFQKSIDLLDIIPRGARLSVTFFATVLEATHKLKALGDENQWLGQILFEKVKPTFRSNMTLANPIVRQNSQHLELALTPNIPNSVGTVEHSEVFFSQLKQTNEALTDDIPKVRVTAIKCFEQWCNEQWSSLCSDFPEHARRNLENVVIMTLDHKAPEVQQQALKTLQSIFLNVEGARKWIGDMIQARTSCNPDGEIQTETLIGPVVDISVCLTSPNRNTRKEFVMFLRVINKFKSVRVNKVCPLNRLFSQLSKENNNEVIDAIAGLFKHHYFHAKSATDKGIVLITPTQIDIDSFRGSNEYCQKPDGYFQELWNRCCKEFH